MWIFEAKWPRTRCDKALINQCRQFIILATQHGWQVLSFFWMILGLGCRYFCWWSNIYDRAWLVSGPFLLVTSALLTLISLKKASSILLFELHCGSKVRNPKVANGTRYGRSFPSLLFGTPGSVRRRTNVSVKMADLVIFRRPSTNYWPETVPRTFTAINKLRKYQ